MRSKAGYPWLRALQELIWGYNITTSARFDAVDPSEQTLPNFNSSLKIGSDLFITSHCKHLLAVSTLVPNINHSSGTHAAHPGWCIHEDQIDEIRMYDVGGWSETYLTWNIFHRCRPQFSCSKLSADLESLYSVRCKFRFLVILELLQLFCVFSLPQKNLDRCIG